MFEDCTFVEGGWFRAGRYNSRVQAREIDGQWGLDPKP